MRVGIHRVGNKFPYILRYIFPRLLNRFTYLSMGKRVYKWLYWYIEIDRD